MAVEAKESQGGSRVLERQMGAESAHHWDGGQGEGTGPGSE